MTRFKRLKKPLVSLAVLVLMLPVGEVLVRLFTNTSPPLVMRDPEVGRRFVPSFEGEVFDSESKREILVRTNRDGFRGPEWTLEAPPNTRRIAIIGDSMTAALSMEEDQSLCGQLAERLGASHPGVEWQVMNFGVLGSSTAQECLIYEKVARRYAPDFVLCCFFSGNDLADNHRGLTSNPRIYFDFDESGELKQLPFSASRSAGSRWLNLNSRLYVWQKQLLKRSRIGRSVAGPSLREADWVFSSDPPATVAHAWKITEALLERFRHSVLEDGSRFCLVHVPCAKQVYADAFQGVVTRSGEAGAAFERDHPDSKLRLISRGLGAPFVSLTDSLRAAAPSDSRQVEDEWLFYSGTGHWNERGNAIGAETLHAFLTEPGPDGASMVDGILDVRGSEVRQ